METEIRPVKETNTYQFKILIIDDETDICYLLSMLLKKKNFATSYVNSLSEAVIALEKESPNLVFLDNHLPDGLGLNFIEHIKSTKPDCKIVMITAHDTVSDRERAMREGVDQFIGKPFNRETIYQTVEQLLN